MCGEERYPVNEWMENLKQRRMQILTPWHHHVQLQLVSLSSPFRPFSHLSLLVLLAQSPNRSLAKKFPWVKNNLKQCQIKHITPSLTPPSNPSKAPSQTLGTFPEMHPLPHRFSVEADTTLNTPQFTLLGRFSSPSLQPVPGNELHSLPPVNCESQGWDLTPPLAWPHGVYRGSCHLPKASFGDGKSGSRTSDAVWDVCLMRTSALPTHFTVRVCHHA